MSNVIPIRADLPPVPPPAPDVAAAFDLDQFNEDDLPVMVGLITALDEATDKADALFWMAQIKAAVLTWPL